MQKPSEKTEKMLLVNTEKEVFDAVVPRNHPFRKLNDIIDWSELFTPIAECYSSTGTPGIDVEKGVKALLIQFWEDYSDREMEKCARENFAVRWFCSWGLMEATPDYSYFSKLRKRIGAKRIAELFNRINDILEGYGLFGNVFTFIDASTIITKTALWEERDRAIKDGAKKLNNTNVHKYAADNDARWGAKSKKNIWFGHKRHTAVDMRYGLVKKVTVTAANVPDFKAVKSIAPKQGAVFMDKMYDTKKTDAILNARGIHASTIRKNNNRTKNRDLDRWRSGIRMPFEGVFSKMSKRARYRGHAKVVMQAFLQAITHNLKKAVRILTVETPVMQYAT
jgi:IS5 family transposase